MNWRQLLMGLGSMAAGAKAVKGAVDENRRNKRQQELTQGEGPKVTVHKVRTIEERVQYIVGMIRKGKNHGKVHAFTRSILGKKCGPEFCIEEKDFRGEIEAIYGAVKENVRYTGDTWGTDLFQHPKNVLKFGTGDCDDMCVVLGSALQSIGYPVKLRVVHLKGDKTWGHIYLLAGIPPNRPKKWMPLDGGVVPPKPAGWQVPKHMVKRFRDFPVPP